MKATRTWEIILVFLLLIVVAGFSATTEGFLDFYNLSDSTFNYSEKALIALVMALVIIAGEIDISVAATVALTSVMMGLAKNAGAGVGVIILVGLASGALCGALNGFLITRFALPSIVVTIGTLSLYRGMALVILGFEYLADDSVINLVYKVASYTYGPILGMFAFGMFTRLRIRDGWMPVVAVAAPVLSALVQYWAREAWDYRIGFELLIYNAVFTMAGMLLLAKKNEN